MSATAAIYRTSIGHVRRTPLKNAFTYRSYSWYVDVDRPPVLPRLLRPLPGFRAAAPPGDPPGHPPATAEALPAPPWPRTDGKIPSLSKPSSE